MQATTVGTLLSVTRDLLSEWGKQQRRMANGGVYVDVKRSGETVKIHFPDGHSSTSTIARFKDLFDGAGSTTRVLVQFREEGIHDDALLISRALVNAPEDIRNWAWIYAVPPWKVEAKTEVLQVSRAEYFRNVDRMLHFIAGRIDVSQNIASNS